MANVYYKKDEDGNPRRNRDGSITFYIRVYIGEDGDGSQIIERTKWRAPKEMRLSTAERKADVEAQRFEDIVRAGPRVTGKKYTFAEYAEIYLEETNLTLRTVEGYEELLVRINPAFGHVQLDKLTEKHLSRLYSKMREPGNNKNKLRAVAKPALAEARKAKGWSQRQLATKAGINHVTLMGAEKGERLRIQTAEKIAAALKAKKLDTLFAYTGEDAILNETTIWHHHKFIASVFAAAVTDKVLRENVAAGMKNPPKRSKDEIKTLSDDEAYRFTQRVLEESNIRKKALLLVAILTGFRKGELAGLSWDDIVERRNGYVMSVRRVSLYTRKKGVIVKDPKNNASLRVLGIPQKLANFLLGEYHEWWYEQRERCGGPEGAWLGDTERRLFVGLEGKPLHPSTLYAWLQDFLVENGFERVSLHSLRHTNIALMILQGIDVKTIQARSGHTQTKTVLDTYAYFFESAQARAADVLDDLLLSPKK